MFRRPNCVTSLPSVTNSSRNPVSTSCAGEDSR